MKVAVLFRLIEKEIAFRKVKSFECVALKSRSFSGFLSDSLHPPSFSLLACINILRQIQAIMF